MLICIILIFFDIFKFQDIYVCRIILAIAQIVANKTKLCLLCDFVHFLLVKAMENNDLELTLLAITFLWILLFVSLNVSFINLKNWDDCLFLFILWCCLIFQIRIWWANFLFFFFCTNSSNLDNLAIGSDKVFFCVLNFALLLAELSWLLHLFTIVRKNSLLRCFSILIEVE